MSIGSRIREERKRQHLTLRSLAEKADISISYLGDIEKERSKPSVDRLKDIASALGKNIAYFVVDDDAVYEEENVYRIVDEEIDSLLKELMTEDGFKDILKEFDGFSCWSEREKAELLYFLKAKREYRKSTNI